MTIIYAIFLDWLVFHQIPTANVWFGVGLFFLSGLLMIFYKTKRGDL